MPALFDRVTRARYAVLAVACALIWLDTLTAVEGEGSDWHFFLEGARGLTGSSGLHVFADRPFLQFGPLALVVGLALRHVGPLHGWVVVSAIGMVLGVVAIRLLERAAVALDADPDRAAACVLVGGPFFLATWASPAVSQGHPDDVLALLAIAAAIWALATDRWVTSAVLVGLSSAAKPWALLILPLALARSGSRARGLLIAVAAAVVPWLPFLIAAPSTTRLGRFHIGVEATSTLHYLGMSINAHPAWPRYAQLAVALVLGAVAVYRRNWILVPLLAFAVRINLDPATIDYYAAGPVMGAFAWELVAPLRVPGLRTILVWFALLYVPSDLRTLGAGGSAYDATIVVARMAVLALAVWVGVAQSRLRPIRGLDGQGSSQRARESSN